MNRNWTLLLALLCALPAADAHAQQRLADEPVPVDTTVRMDTLANGLRYYVRVNQEPRERAELRLVVDAGSVLEDADQRGLAHFVEHMAFNGTQNFPEQALTDYLESVGMRFGPDVNAYTSFDETVYMLTLPTDSAGVLETGFEILEDWAGGVTFDSLEVEKERGVVIEEWRQGQGAGARLREQQFPVLMRGSRYAERLPIGTLESLQSFDHAALRRFYRDWYRPDLMAVVAVGDFDADSVEALIRRRFGRLERPEQPRERAEFEVPPHPDTRVSVATDPEATSSSVDLYLKRPPEPWLTVGAYRDWIVESLASSMLVNRLTERTYRPDAPFLDVSSFQGRFTRPLAAYVLNVRVPEGGAERGLAALLEETERAVRHGFTATELEREKRELLRIMERRYEERHKLTSAGLAAEYVSNFLYGGRVVDVPTEYRLYTRLVPQVTLADVDAAARDWSRSSDRVVLVSTPADADAPPPAEAALRDVLRAAPRQPVTAFVDEVSSAPLVPRLPEPRPIVAERSLPATGITEWTLANGVRVVLKPTDFREDEVLLAARSPGGTSLLPDADYIAALTTPAVVQAGGLGELSVVELRKHLTGTVAGVGADLDAWHERLAGAASPDDLETLLQLVYLKFTAPRMDTTAFLTYRQQLRAMLENRSASPEQQFTDTLRAVLSQHHPRARPLTTAMLDSLDLHRSFEIYRERFADASDFTFFLVGSFDPGEIRPLVERYLGGLPSLGREERGRDLGVWPPAGVVRRTVYAGMEPKGRAALVFSGELDFGRASLQAIETLSDVLTLRLREVLREELGGTYGAQVSGSGRRDPLPHYQLHIGFGADPDRLHSLVDTVFAQIESLQRTGPTADEMRKVHEMQQREREVALRRNHFWIEQMMEAHRYQWDYADLLAESAPRVDAGTVRAAARRYLDPDRYVQLLLLPESLAPGEAPRTAPDSTSHRSATPPDGRTGGTELPA